MRLSATLGIGFAVGFSLASPARAMLCEEGLTTPSATLLPPVIDAVMRGDYREMTLAMDPEGALPEADRQRIMAELETRMPLGYDDCAVLVARSLGADFDTYLILFSTGRERLYAFLGVSRIDGIWQVVYPLFTPDFAAAYSLLR